MPNWVQGLIGVGIWLVALIGLAVWAAVRDYNRYPRFSEIKTYAEGELKQAMSSIGYVIDTRVDYAERISDLLFSLRNAYDGRKDGRAFYESVTSDVARLMQHADAVRYLDRHNALRIAHVGEIKSDLDGLVARCEQHLDEVLHKSGISKTAAA